MKKHENKMLWTQRDNKNAKHEKQMKCMQEELDLSRGIQGGVEEDFDRLTHVSSRQKVKERGSMYWGGVKEDLDVSRRYRHV